MGLVTRKRTYEPQTKSPGFDGSAILHDHNAIHHAQNHSLPENRSPHGHDYSPFVARATNDAVRDWNIVTGALSWPQGLESLLGHPPTEESASLAFWQQRVHPADRARLATSIREALAERGDHWSGEYRFQCADGEYLQILERAFLQRDTSGQPIRWIGSLMDITARTRLQDQLCRSQKMEAFGQLAGGVAHDFNNFLTTILGYSDLVLSEAGAKGTIASHVAEIRSAAGRASVLTGQLLAFSRKQALDPHIVEVNDLVQNLERSLLRLLGDNITVVCHLQRDKAGAHIKVDPGQLTQIILNLAVNARDAMRGGGQVTLETDTAVLTAEDPAASGLDLPAGEYVVIRVVDTGVGMTDEVKDHLFEPFFTTKHAGTGTGLGLATSYGIVRQSGGSILIESAVNKGTRVQIYLPRVGAPPPPSYKKPADRKFPVGTETILVLEDDISVRHMSVRILRNLGYQVMEAATGDDAQRLFGENAARRIHLLLTDMVMPYMSGRFFADWLRKVSPETRVVFVSGYLEESLHPGDRLENGMFFLPKPFDPEQLARTVRQALDS